MGWSIWKPRPAWANEAASWLLWLGTAFALAAMALGLLAESTAPHVPAAWRVMDRHEDLGKLSAGVLSALAIARYFLKRRYERWIFAGWLGASALILATAYYGGELVFRFGVGVVSP